MLILLKLSRASEASSSSAYVGHAVSHGTNPQEQHPRQHLNNQNPSSSSKLPQPPSFIRTSGNRPFTAGSDDVYSSNYRQTNSNYRPTNHFSSGPPDSTNSNSAGFRYSEVRLNPGTNRRSQAGTIRPALLNPGPPYASVNSPNYEIKINTDQRRQDNADGIMRLNTQQSQFIPTYQDLNSSPGRIRIRMPQGQSLRIRL